MQVVPPELFYFAGLLMLWVVCILAKAAIQEYKEVKRLKRVIDKRPRVYKSKKQTEKELDWLLSLDETERAIS